ncbi:N-acetylmuramoyl-L-alanine amidase [Vibrio crassostreae]|nr:N-acetylmuramoyl-L-alanine amidase [Vibrio crassostreae]TCT51331.1 N-acetylmuramoyl-L-alanine amidase [Vibrio crassostreae]TCT70258.1 N-acetylmuramoyl-L-alanine amidase [Vibrio crassostreae]TCT76160.1 N-acetylmuramoyl-L-alanine amidase [Vibrio crassostreae]TCT95350.1 N-acetylmuramoyl-L-alanine amidase [Vibrio crassostreae]
MSNTPPATDRVPHQPLEASVLPEQASKVALIPSLEPCLSPASYSLSLVSVLLRLPFCPPYSFITVHCSATPPQQDVDVAEIRRWHKKRGWRDVGYHFVIRRNGDVELGRPLSQTGAHVKGHNKSNIGVCLVGGCNAELQPEDNFTLAQRKALFGLMAALQEQFLIPEENVKGHKDWGVNKACPVLKIKA